VEYEKGSIYDAIRKAAMRFPYLIACEFMQKQTSYRDLLHHIDKAAEAFFALGIREGDTVLLCFPNCFSAVVSLYALNKLGAVVTPIHPLSQPYELEEYLKISNSNWVITLDLFVHHFAKLQSIRSLKGVVFRSLSVDMPFYLKPLYRFKKGKEVSQKDLPDHFVAWKDSHHDLKPNHCTPNLEPKRDRTNELAVILFSGGTTGKPKGVMLANKNFNALAMQIGSRGHAHEVGGKMLGILPIFHGYGLGVCIHTFLFWGAQVILVPVFTPEKIGKLIRKKKPSFFPTVPRILDAVIQTKDFQKADLSCLKHINSGGDKLPERTRRQLKTLLETSGSMISIVEGYGLTETLSGCIAMPEGEYRPGSIGKPFPDMLVKIVHPGTIQEIPDMEDGEICVSGPSVMLGYLNDDQETAKVLKTHEDGRLWLHTGDIGYRDPEGYFYFKQRIKRMIKVSGMMVYPVQVEEVLNLHPDVAESCVIGIPDTQRGQKIKAVVALKESIFQSAENEKKSELIHWCKDHLIPLRCPKEIDFLPELPRTKFGKIDFRALEKANGVTSYE